MRILKKAVSFFVTLAMVMSIISMTGMTSVYAAKKVKVTSVTVPDKSLTLTVGEKYTIVPTIAPENATNKKVKYSSSKKKVATVTSKGKITAKKAGTAKITVKAADGSGKKATVTVKVVKKAASSVAASTVESSEEAQSESSEEPASQEEEKKEESSVAEETSKEEEKTEEEKKEESKEEKPAATSGKLTAKGADYTVELTYDDKAGIPEGSVLEVEEIKEGTKDYEKYFNKTNDKIADDLSLSFARFFDITITSNGGKVEPKTAVHVEISYSGKGTDIGGSAAIGVIHFADNGTELIDDVQTDISGSRVKSVEYEQESFSVVGTIGTSGFTTLDSVADKYFAVYTSKNNTAYALTHTYGDNYGKEAITTATPKVLAGEDIDGEAVWEAKKGKNGYVLFYHDLDDSSKIHYLTVSDKGVLGESTTATTEWSTESGYLKYQNASSEGYLAYENETLTTTDSIASATQILFATVEEHKARGNDGKGSVLRASNAKAADEAPAHSKNLIDNGDGTYTLALSVTGATSSSSTTTVKKSNVVLVIDTSNSMNSNYTTYNGTRMRRIEAEKHVLADTNGIVDKLLANNTTAYPDIIEIALVNFGTRGVKAQDFTTNATTLKNTINGFSTSTGTNWEEGLTQAKSYADTIKSTQPDEDVYIIFLTDGEPTTHAGSYNVNTNYGNEWGHANGVARDIVTAGYKFYGIFTWGSGNSSHYLSSLVNYAYTGTGNYNTALDSAYAEYFTDATDTQDLIDALESIAHTIGTNVGYTNVEMTDGVTEMTTSSVKVSASGDVTGLKYYRSGGSYSTTANNGLGEEWTDAPEAEINAKGEVDWNLGNIVLENGVTYTVSFTVWPSQESLDLVADLNNGIIEYDSLTDDQKSQISVSGGKYHLKTNTDYPTITYSTVTTTTDSATGETTTVVSDPKTETIPNPDPVNLAEERLNAKKEWEDELDPSQRDEVEDVTLKLKVDGKYYYVDEQGEAMGVKLTEESNWTETDYISIAPGILVTSDSPAYDPDAPHFTWEGKSYAMLEAGHEYVFEEENINTHYELIAYTHHPMIMGSDSSGNPIIKDVVFTKDAAGNLTGIESVENLGDTLSATNIIKGGVSISKKVVGVDGKEVDTTDKFTITMHMKDADGNDYSYDYRIYYGENNPEYESHIVYNEDGSIKYSRSDHIYGSGTAEIELYVGDEIRFVNIDADTRYYVEETTPTAPYNLDGIAYTVRPGNSESYSAYDEDHQIADGDTTWYVVSGNTAGKVEVTNKKTGYFYVYHSSDNTVEKISITDSRVNKNGQFDITDEVKDNYLYGGYYKVYGGTTATDAEIMALTYTDSWATDSKGESYDGSSLKASDGTTKFWIKKTNAYTDEKGTEMKPVVDTVYYLKEVPDAYLHPYTLWIYDWREKTLDDLYFIGGVDDNNYNETGTILEDEQHKATRLTNTIKITRNNEEATYDVSVTIKDTESSLSRGYLSTFESSDIISSMEKKTLKQIPYWVTPDDVLVQQDVGRTVYWEADDYTKVEVNP